MHYKKKCEINHAKYNLNNGVPKKSIAKIRIHKKY